ncbi:retrotransposon protein [Cucumis melo var. makuwa]|uniref:Retrotransposon protein n=1 Tax=Cucumis melo var. makuwa TaxID=1194695 RepID=A0A5D3C2M7_CUCMM|nr:retrotransposon protein [Cucumis melo var. makuwa]
MDRRCFAILHHLLRIIAGLTSTEVIDVKEMVAMFLHIVAHDVKNRVIQRKFMRSGALDRAYIKVNIPASDWDRYRTRKEEVATNVLGVCDTKGDFVYVDVGYPNAEDFLAPYKGQRYHLQEWRDAENAPSTSKGIASTPRLPKHSWTKEEEAGLVELVHTSGWRSDNGTFRPWNLNQLARMTAFKIPEKEVFHDWMKSHLLTKGLLNKSFPHYDELSYVFGKDHVTEGRTETFVDVGSTNPVGYETFTVDAAPDMDFQLMYVSSGSKRKREGQAADSGEVIRTAIECRLMRILMRNIDDMKAFLDVPDNMKYPYCNIILEENQ